MKLHLDPPVDEYWTHRNIKNYCKKNDIDLRGDYSEEALRNYLWMDRSKSPEEFETEEEYDEFKKKLNRKIFFILKDLIRFKATTLTGRVRSNATFASAANTVFQGLTADGCKLALWYLYLAGYKIIDFIHDEVIIELDEDKHLQKNVKKCEELMLQAMGQIIKRVKIGVESALMYRWDKDADPVYDDEGNLIVWTPGENKDDKIETEEKKIENPMLF